MSRSSIIMLSIKMLSPLTMFMKKLSQKIFSVEKDSFSMKSKFAMSKKLLKRYNVFIENVM